MNDDLRELLKSLKSHGVEFLVTGAHAVVFHGRPRFTQDVGLWVSPGRANADALAGALEGFGAPIGELGARQFAEWERQMIRIGASPNMVDILNFAGTKSFADVWRRRADGDMAGERVSFPSIDDLVDMKRAAGRPQDVADIEHLRASPD